MTQIEAMLVILEKEIADQQKKMAASHSNIDTEILDALTTAKFQLEEVIRLRKAH